MFKVGVHSRVVDDSKIPFLIEIFEILEEYGIEVHVSHKLIDFTQKKRVEIPTNHSFGQFTNISFLDFMISLGGDGTLLDTITYIKGSGVPILGINLGRLGFLATVRKTNFKETLDKIIAKEYSLEERTLVQAISNKPLFGGLDFGLNEFAILKQDTAAMLIIHTYIDGEFLNSYWADGLLVSTPTGSTGYSLSVGGPIVTPNSKTFIVAPISPHHLNVRPLIVSEESNITFKIESRSKNYLVTIDSRYEIVNNSFEFGVKKCDYKIKLFTFKDHHFIETLRKKLNWGFDSRNR